MLFLARVWGQLSSTNKYVKFRDPSLNCSREIPRETVRVGIIVIFFHYNFLPEVDNDVIPSVAVDNVGMHISVNYDDSRSIGSCDIPGADFVSNESDQ